MTATQPLVTRFTSTGFKFANHPASLRGLRTNDPHPVVSHIMGTDVCAHKCAFCSVQSRDGDTLEMSVIRGYLDQMVPLGLKAVILSGGGNPILYRKGGFDFNDMVDEIHGRGLEIGVISDGMALVDYAGGRSSWKTVKPETLDKLTWLRISMAGLDHPENQVFVPDIDPDKTTLGFSYVYHDIYEVPQEPHHGKVSTAEDLVPWGTPNRVRLADDRFATLTQQIGDIVRKHNPEYVRLLPNCLEVDKIAGRCDRLREMATLIDPSRVFVQFKPPEAPAACYLGYLHPVLNCDGYVYPCDSCVLNKSAGHKFAVPWRMCRWDEIGEFYKRPVQSLIKNPAVQCSGCVFTGSNRFLTGIVSGDPIPEPQAIQHPNFV